MLVDASMVCTLLIKLGDTFKKVCRVFGAIDSPLGSNLFYSAYLLVNIKLLQSYPKSITQLFTPLMKLLSR